MNRCEILPYAEQIVEALRPGCLDIAIAGSLRRGKPDVKDIEIVARPKTVSVKHGLFGEAKEESALDSYIAKACRDDLFIFDPAIPRNGEKYKRFRSPRLDQPCVAIDLFVGDEDNYGNTLAIRTGDKDFSKLLVTPRCWEVSGQGGLMPINLAHIGGYLYYYHDQADAMKARKLVKPMNGTKMCCETEEDFFHALQLPVWPVADRTKEGAARILTQLSRKEK